MTTPQEPTTLNLLFIDDDQEEFVLTRELLRSVEGFHYIIAWEPSLEAGLSALKNGAFDACLVDFRLGKHTGIDLIRAAVDQRIGTPILLATGYREPGLDTLALQAGGADFLIKGTLDSEGLHRSIRHAITRHQVLQQAIQERTRLAAFGAEMGRALTCIGCLDETLQACTRVMAEFLPVQLAQIHVFNPRNGEFRLVGCEGPLSATLPREAPEPVDYIHGERCISCPAVGDHRLGDTTWLLKNRILTGVTCPLMLDQHLLGLITLHSRDALSHPILEELGSVVPAVASFLARFSLESQVQRTQQMDCVGKMATGLAHEFKNNLAVIRTHVWETMEALEEAPPAAIRELLNHILDVTDSANKVAQQLMLFARPDDVEFRPLDLQATLLSLRPMIQGAVDQRVSITFRSEAVKPAIESNPTLLQQILVNLACNARDAMPEGGALLIETTNVHVDSIQAATSPEAHVGDYVRLRVKDTGCGMTPETRARLFEPFFTTKPPGKGNGLGLATVFSIVRQHKGWMEVLSEVGKGTTFQIYFLESTQPVPTPPPASLAPQCLPKSGVIRANQERVLIVEDEPVLRMAAEQVLKRANFNVTSAASGQEALKAWVEQGGRFDLLLTDLSMPDGMTGMQLASQLTRENPRIKVILTSGYAPEMIDRNLHGNEAMFLQKPYPPSALPETVSSCLGI